MKEKRRRQPRRGDEIHITEEEVAGLIEIRREIEAEEAALEARRLAAARDLQNGNGSDKNEAT